MNRRLQSLLLALGLSSFVIAGCSVQRGDVDTEEDVAEHGIEQGLTLSEKLDVEEKAFLQLINDYRVSQGKSKLLVSIALTDASKFHSTDMATKSYFSHTSQDGTTFSDRVKRYYDHSTWLAENIAAGNASAAATFEQWRTSPGHNTNMLGDDYKVIGIGRAYSATSPYGWYWTTDFGGYVDATLTDDGATPPPPPPPPPEPSANLLTGGGFEGVAITNGVYYTSVRTTGRWYAYATSGGSAAVSSSSAASGATGLRIVDKDPGYVLATQVVAGKAGTKYALSAKVRRFAGSAPQSMWIDWLDASYRSLGRTRVWTSTSSTFSAVTTSGAAPTGTAYLRVVLYATSSTGYASTFDWDDVSLATAP